MHDSDDTTTQPGVSRTEVGALLPKRGRCTAWPATSPPAPQPPAPARAPRPVSGGIDPGAAGRRAGPGAMWAACGRQKCAVAADPALPAGRARGRRTQPRPADRKSRLSPPLWLLRESASSLLSWALALCNRDAAASTSLRRRAASNSRSARRRFVRPIGDIVRHACDVGTDGSELKIVATICSLPSPQGARQRLSQRWRIKAHISSGGHAPPIASALGGISIGSNARPHSGQYGLMAAPMMTASSSTIAPIPAMKGHARIRALPRTRAPSLPRLPRQRYTTAGAASGGRGAPMASAEMVVAGHGAFSGALTWCQFTSRASAPPVAIAEG